MRLERHGGGRPATLPRPTSDTIDDLHVAAVQPVEVAERQHGLVPAGWGIVREVSGVHVEYKSCQPSAVGYQPCASITDAQS